MPLWWQTISCCCTRSPAHLNRAAANKLLEPVPGASVMWEQAGRGASQCPTNCCTFLRQDGMFCACPTTILQHSSKTIWVSDCNLCCLQGSPGCWRQRKWASIDTYTPKDHFTQTGQKRLSPATASVTFPSVWCVLPLCSIVIPSGLAKRFSVDSQVLDLTATLQSLVTAVSLLPLSNWQKVCTASILATRLFNSEI